MVQIRRAKVPSGASNLVRQEVGSISGELDEIRASAEQNRQISNLAENYFTSAVNAQKEDEYNTAFINAQKELQQGYKERSSQVVDEDGKPIYDSLVKDTESLGSQIREKYASQLSTKSGQQKFNTAFDGVVGEAQLKAFNTARNQMLDFNQANLDNNLRDLTQAAIEDDIISNESYIIQANDMLDGAMASGLLTATQAEARKAALKDSIKEQSIEKIISSNPTYAEQLLENKASDLGLQQDTYTSLKRQLVAKQKDMAFATRQAKQEVENDEKKQQAIVDSDLRLQIATGEAGSAEVEKAFSSGQISRIQRNQRLLQVNATKKSTLKSNQQLGDVLDAVKNGRPIFNASTKTVNNAFLSMVGQLETENQKQATLTDKAGVATNFSVPINSFSKELSYATNFGDVKDATDLLTAYNRLETSKNFIISTLDEKSQTTLALASVLSEGTGIGDRQALQQARDFVSNRTPEQVQQFSKQFANEEAFNLENMNSTITDEFNLGAIFGDDIPVNQDVIPSLRLLYQKAYADTGGDLEATKKRVKMMTKDYYGVSSVGKTQVFTILPPEQVYGLPSETLREAFLTELKGIKGGLEQYIPQYETFRQISPEDVEIESNTVTVDNVRTKGYQMYIVAPQGYKIYLTDPNTGQPKYWGYGEESLTKLREIKEQKKQEAIEDRREALRQQELNKKVERQSALFAEV